MERYNRDRYYHSGLGTENRRDWDRSTRDGDFGRDYENRFRSDRDRNEDYRRHYHSLEQNYYDNTQGQHHNLDNIRQGYGYSSFESGNNENLRDSGEEIANRMRRDRERLQQQGYGSGRMSGYSGSAFGGSNYSSHGDFGGSSDYGAMSGDDGNVEDYVSMSGYGGGQGSISTHSDRDYPNYSRSRFSEQYGNYDRRDNDRSQVRGNYSDSNYRRNSDRIDRGGYENYDPNNRWNS